MWLRGPTAPTSLIYLLIIYAASSQFTTVYTQIQNNTDVKKPEAATFQASEMLASNRTNVTMYAWTAWGPWSACSKTCGGGVAVQERHCLPKDPARWRKRRRRRMPSSVRQSRRARDVNRPNSDCEGIGRRYHECNTVACPGQVRDSRAEQCAAYDRRPFRGHFYTWVPYVDGNAPCVLNCRPRGQQFYASLALVTDGTSCTKPGFRAICVQGECKVVGRDGVLAAVTSRDDHCGSRLVSGIFSRARLPLGYSFVTTIPKGACHLNVSELATSENYIALKATNGSYIMNGEFAVSAPGVYEAAGTRFVYKRVGGLDNVLAKGPIHHPIDIMILYTQPNPSIKYEYLTESDKVETSNDIPTSNHNARVHHSRHHRHHEPMSRSLENSKTSEMLSRNSIESRALLESNDIGERKFAWKILSFTQCSRSCGGGLQVGKFKCVESSKGEDKEVSPAHCTGTPPPSRRRRCGTAQCPPRWRAAPWSPCPVCGPATRTRIVGCVQDHARGITKISDQKCPLPMPPNSEPCNIPNCDGTPFSTNTSRPDVRRQVRPVDKIDTFRDGPVVSMPTNVSNDITPTTGHSYSYSAPGGWLYTEWSDCVGWCSADGVQSRGVRCADPAGCTGSTAPPSSQHCTVKKQCEAQWFTSEWSACSATCNGLQVRGVLCISGNGRRLRDGACHAQRPEAERACGGDCAPSWYLSDWSECQGPCEAGVQTRTVWCARGGTEGASGAARDAECTGSGMRPAARRACVPARCTTRPVVKPVPVNTADTQQRVTRHQIQNTQQFSDKSPSDKCVDKLANCMLAVQARLCHYPYYESQCCHSCHGR